VRHIGHVVGMMVRDPIQGRGIGRALLAALIDEARGPAALELLTLTVTLGNDRAVRLYESSGFVRFGTLARALKLGIRYFDKIHMAKPL
jgi:GNAT superfamily N-acetyltransferase